VDAVRKVFRDGGFAGKKDEVESGGTFLVGVRGILYSIHNDYQWHRSSRGYLAIGTGDEIALGAMHATHNVKSPIKRLEYALLAAEELGVGIRGPFTYVSSARVR
jgi:hypothetical protein